MKLPGQADHFDGSDSILGGKRATSPIDIVRRQKPQPRGPGRASFARPQFHGQWKHLDAPFTADRIRWRELMVTAGAWIAMVVVLAALVYVAYTVYRYAQPL